MFLKPMGRKKNKHRKIALLSRTKLNIIQNIICKVLIDSDVSHDEFVLGIEEENYFRLKNIGVKENQLGGIEQKRLIEHGRGTRENERDSLKVRTDV